MVSKPAKRTYESVDVDVPFAKRQKKITSLLQPAKESLHLRDKDSDTEVTTDDAAGHPDEVEAISIREEEVQPAAKHADEEALESADGCHIRKVSDADVRPEKKGGNVEKIMSRLIMLLLWKYIRSPTLSNHPPLASKPLLDHLHSYLPLSLLTP